ncbi:CCC motif membrane protein [Flavobacterium lindanitolerans]|uniref:CCC motif membrane protein n=1 Tax=Flavobacterium lindanitolerans TaxID=428988 RepID=UPI0027BA3C80|nr:CCC motif membrane protein [Flavobacterium lindanitolerans]
MEDQSHGNFGPESHWPESGRPEPQRPEPLRPEPYRKLYYRKQLPNAVTVLILGIMSIIAAFCYGFFGIVLGIIALVIARNDMQLHRENPGEYDGYPNLSAGRVCAIIGLSLGSLFFIGLFFLFFLTTVFS